MAGCLLIDGNNIVFRAFYAFQSQRLRTRSGTPTGALFGFTRMLVKLLRERQPELVAVAFDVSRDTFRRKLYPEYKAQRKPVPQELLDQIPLAHQVTAALGIPVVTHEGYEADDLIGTLAQRLAGRLPVAVVTGDRDLLQLINTNVVVELCQKGTSDTRLYDEQTFQEEYGFPPVGIIELKALMGDSSDNIPGVKGIGEKKGSALIREFQSIDALYADPARVGNDKLREKLLQDRNMAFLSRDLATIRCDVELDLPTEKLRWNERAFARPEFTKALATYEFTSLLDELSHAGLIGAASAAAAVGKRTIEAEKLLLTRLEDVEAFLNEVDQVICVDLETDGLDPYRDRIVGIALAASKEKAAYIPLRHAYLGISADDQIPLDRLRPLLQRAFDGRLLVGHNLKFDLAFLRGEGIPHHGDFFDTMLAAYLLDPTRSIGLKPIARERYGIDVTEFTTVAGKGSFAEVPIADAADYACQDVILSMMLYEDFGAELADKKLTDLLNELEIPLVRVLEDMERTGIGLAADYLHALSERLATRLHELEQDIHEQAGTTFNINSSKQLQDVLFGTLALKPPKKTKTGFSTDSEVLQRLAPLHPICDMLLEYREITKLKTTYADTLGGLVNPSTGLIHTSFNQTVTATGRLSSSNPNLQNIPIKTELGREVRRAFIPPFSGHLFLSFDYSQIELRLLAHFAEDEALVEAFREGRDIHALTASRLFGIPQADVDSGQRRVGKTVNFGIIYGISAHGLAEDLGISRPEAQRYIDGFFAGFPKVQEFFERNLAEAKRLHQVETLFGRIRPVPDIDARNFQARSGAERIARNTPLQGSAADLVKKAMLVTHALLEREYAQTRLILQIHDELVFSCPPEEVETLGPKLKAGMEQVADLKVPLICDGSLGPNLADLEDLDW